MKANELIQELIELTHNNMNVVQSLKEMPIETLHQKEDAQSWNILECVEHLNRYGDFYIPEIRMRIEQSDKDHVKDFKSGILGNYFAKSMLPKEKLNKMKTFKVMNPEDCPLNKNVLDTFLFKQEQLLALLEKSKTINLTKVKTAISISTWIKLRLGDTLRVVIYHNYRHIVQIKNILQNALEYRM
ncbi:MAG: DinB family protein [Saprospiraceae bacterium]|nr:DinB family protein [Saprospiraceae bacterium]